MQFNAFDYHIKQIKGNADTRHITTICGCIALAGGVIC